MKTNLYKQGATLQEKIQTIFPTDEKADTYSYTAAVVYGIISAVFLVLGSLIAIYLASLIIGLAIIGIGLVSAGLGIKHFVSPKLLSSPYESSHSKEEVLNSINDLVESTQVQI
ncbi:MAG: hypothetical protein H0U73_09645 [Tatlockia sp.]|nr:hypothetical protein [Tatlockia sp.]